MSPRSPKHHSSSAPLADPTAPRSAPSAPDDTGELLVRATRALRRRWMQDTARLGLSPHQVRALRVLGDAPVRPGRLAERLRVAPRSATEVADSLERAGLLRREPDPTDRRATLLSLTSRGAEVRRQVVDERRRISTAWLARLPERDRGELHRILTDLDALDARDEAEGR